SEAVGPDEPGIAGPTVTYGEPIRLVNAPDVSMTSFSPAPGTPLGQIEGDTTSKLSGPDGNCAAPAPVVTGRYQLLGEIGRGGMGVVHKGHDQRLGRDLAFKVLLPELAGRAELVRRFIEEARVGGQLQHPGIAPVYDRGTLADQRPFFTMKLVEGRTM